MSANILDTPEIRKLAAQVMGRMGGLAKNKRRASASRRNGRLGGRPRKLVLAGAKA